MAAPSSGGRSRMPSAVALALMGRDSPIQPPSFPYRPFAPGEWRDNGDGTFSTEVSRTVQMDGDWTNVPSLWMGPGRAVDISKMSDDQLAAFAARFERAFGKKFRRWPSWMAAMSQAAKRSNEGGAGSYESRYEAELPLGLFGLRP